MPSRGTFCGLMAILCWSTMIGLVRSVTAALGPLAGAAFIYTMGSVFLWLVFRPSAPGGAPTRYLLAGGSLFVAYEVCLSLSLGLAHNDAQAMELGVINYLWPCFTLLLATRLNGQRLRAWIVPGTAVCLAGVAWVIVGREGLSVAALVADLGANVAANPVAYGLAFSGALLWAIYCNLTRRMADGYNGTTVFFTATALALWMALALTGTAPALPSAHTMGELLLAGAALGAGYALWNTGMLSGNMSLLTTASYACPVLSTAFAAFWLDVALTPRFWQGAVLVTAGSLVCWHAQRPAPAG